MIHSGLVQGAARVSDMCRFRDFPLHPSVFHIPEQVKTSTFSIYFFVFVSRVPIERLTRQLGNISFFTCCSMGRHLKHVVSGLGGTIPGSTHPGIQQYTCTDYTDYSHANTSVLYRITTVLMTPNIQQ